MIIAVRGFQDKGKTATAITLVREYIRIGKAFGAEGLQYSDVYANLHLINMPGSHSLTNPEMRVFIKSMVTNGICHKILLLDEADRLFPARFWQNREQTDALIGLWQDFKLFNIIIYTAHEGTSVDIVLREVTQIEENPEYNPVKDCIDLRVFNALHGIVYEDGIDNISDKAFKYYDRWEAIK